MPAPQDEVIYVFRENRLSAILLTGPAIEPLSLVEAKAFLRVATSDDDDVIAALIADARFHVEAQTRRALITQNWRMALDARPDDGRGEVNGASAWQL